MALSKTVKGLTVEIDGKVDGLGKALKTVESHTKSLKNELKDINTLLKFDPSNVEGLTQKKKVLASIIDECADKLRIMTAAQEQYQEKIGEGNEDEHMRALRREIELTATKMNEYQRELDGASAALNRLENNAADAENDVDKMGDEADEAAREVDNLGDKADKSEDEVSALARAAEKAGDGFTVMKGAVANLLSEALQELLECLKELSVYTLRTGMGFEQSMSRVEALLDPTDRTAKAMQDLTDLAMEMGAKTKFSAGESADAMTYMAQAGWGAQDIMDGLSGVMALAATDGVELATAAEITAQAINALGYEAKDANEFADILAVTAAKTSTNVEDMGYAFQYVGPVAGTLGFEMDELAVAIGLMANAGINGERAGTALRSLFTNMAKPTDAMSEAMEKYGISLTNAEGEMLPLMTIMTNLQTVFDGLSEAQQTELAATLAGKTGMAGLLSIVNAAPEDFAEMADAIAKSGGAAEEMAAIMQDNLAGDVEKLGGAFDTLAVKIVDDFNGALREGAQAITAFLDGEISMTELLDRLKGAFAQAVEVLRGYMPDLLQMGADFVKYIANGILMGIPTLINRSMDIVMSIGSGIAANMQEIVDKGMLIITYLGQSIISSVPKLAAFATNIINSLSSGITQNAGTFISKALDLLDGFANSLAMSVPTLVSSGMNFIKNLVKGLMNALPEFISRAPEIISKFANVINDSFPIILSKGVGIIWELIKGIIKAIPTLIANIPKIITAIVDVWEAFNWLSLGKKAIQLMGNGIKAMWGWIKTAGAGVRDAVINILKNLPQTLLNLGKSAIQFMGNGIKGCGSLISSAAKSIWNIIINFFKGLPDKMWSIGENLIRGLWQGIKNMMSWLWDKVSNFGGTLIGWFEDLFGINSPSKVFAEIGKFLDQGLAEGLLDHMNDPIKAAKKMAEGVLDGAQDMDGFALENNLRQRSVQMAAEVTAKSDSTMLGKLDKILTAIEKGQVLSLDGKQLVGGTVAAYDNALGQRRMLAARGAI